MAQSVLFFEVFSPDTLINALCRALNEVRRRNVHRAYEIAREHLDWKIVAQFEKGGNLKERKVVNYILNNINAMVNMANHGDWPMAERAIEIARYHAEKAQEACWNNNPAFCQQICR